MVVVKLMGGLGNQMFQCAFGRARSLELNTNLILDTSFLEISNDSHTYRKFSLDKFEVGQKIVSKNVKFISRKDNVVDMLQSVIKGEPRLYYVKEKNFNFDGEMLKSKNNSYFDGYWQSFKYFEKNLSLVKDDFKFNFVRENASEIHDRIKSDNSVSVHIRRGDYVSNSETNKYHGVCEPSYYEAAFEIMRQSLQNPVFFIFSDDPVWVTKNYSQQKDVVVVSNPDKSDPHNDLYLMSSCNHAIIANSSFSWWGGWLIENPGKKIIAPSKWFTNPEINTIDLIPDNWLRI